MYSGSTMTPYSGQILGSHQKIDRVAWRHLHKLMPDNHFPNIKTILNFEGDNGPDGIKRKSPAKNEPWHYIQPFDLKDNQLIGLIEGHYQQLVMALKAKDDVRAAFEAAWLAHAVVDGLTPAHHYPYEEKLSELRNGEGIHTRDSIKNKLVMPGLNRKHQVKNNWKMWGPKGLFITHSTFELGFATLLAPMKLTKALPKAQDIDNFLKQPLGKWFRNLAQGIDKLSFYDSFYKTGWTIPLAHRVRRDLAPALVQAVTLVWYGAYTEARSSIKDK